MHAKRVSSRQALCASAAVAAALLLHGQGFAQTASAEPPMFPALDKNGVDLSSGRLRPLVIQASVGVPGQGGLVQAFIGGGLRDNLVGAITHHPHAILPNYPDAMLYTVSFGGVSSTFLDQTGAGSVFTQYGNADGATLTAGASSYTFTGADGTVAVFSTTLAGGTPPAGAETYPGLAFLTSVTRPNGETLTYNYTKWDPACATGCSRLQSVVSNLGYMIAYTYAASDGSAASLELTSVKGINLAQEYCDPLANGCATTNAWSATSFTGFNYGTGTLTATDSLSRATTYTFSSDKITQIKKPSGATINVAYDGNGRVYTVSNGLGTWTYTYTTLGDGSLQTTVTDPTVGSPPASSTRVVVVDPKFGRITSDTDALQHATSYMLDNLGRITNVTYPEGNILGVAYDSRGNVNTITQVAKSGSGLPNHVTTLNYDASCSNPKTCNQPNSVVADGAQTDFTYDSNSGGVTTITQPAGANSVRPVITNTYSAHTASYLIAPGVVSPASSSVYKLDQSSRCMTQASCVGTADEVRTVVNYGTGSPNNLLPVSITQQDGTGALAATNAFTYDIRGDVNTVDGPLPGTSDTVKYRHDAARQLVGFVGVDPDTPSSGRPSSAIQYDYTVDGLPADIKYGTVASQSDADWSAFTNLETVGFVYDSADRVTEKFINTFPSGSAMTQEATQYSYDAANRITCSSARMNPAIFSSLPADACTLGTAGSYGPDRIRQYTYDANNRLTKAVDGYGTSAQRTTQALGYTTNGRLQTLADGKGNLTTFVYDGFDRLSQFQFPSPTSPGQSSTTDYLQYTYNETTWNVDTLRLRDGQSITNSYDWRHNMTAKNLPFTNYTYDNFNRLTSIASGGQTLNETYDALGRRTAETGPLGTVSSQYDAAGRRTRLSLPDGYFSTYDYDNAGAMIDIKDQGGTTLVTLGYDSFNRLQSLSRYDGVSTTYGYDTLSRITSLAQTFAGTSNPNNVTISLAFNPANEITSRTLSNSVYQWVGSKATTSYGVNGLNQVASAGAISFTYDGRGDLTYDGTKTYAYDAANRLTTAGPLTLTWDPTNRLAKTVSGATTTQYLYDGPDVVAEYDANGAEQKRYVHGPGLDQPLVIYENGTADWPLADERGSIMAVANNTGGSLATNTYDEYGLPGASNYGRFQYTGQAWLPDAGLYHYKARAYSPGLGRFMQPDPLGYDPSPNLYAYAHSDPVDRSDPLGLTDPPTVRLLPQNSTIIPEFTQVSEFTITADRRPQPVYDVTSLQSAMREMETLNAQGINRASFLQDAASITFGSNPTVGKPLLPWYPNGRINTGKTGNLLAAFNDLLYLVTLNGGDASLPPNFLTDVTANKVSGWQTTQNGQNGYITNTNIQTGISLRFNGPDVRVEIPPGAFVTPGFRNTSGVPEVVHYSKGP